MSTPATREFEGRVALVTGAGSGIGRPEEVAAVIVFLLSDRCGFGTGGAFPVGGGYLAR